MTFLLDFLNKNLHFPEEAVKKELQGTVIVQMVVEKDGTDAFDTLYIGCEKFPQSDYSGGMVDVGGVA